jgi:hypothetical protein
MAPAMLQSLGLGARSTEAPAPDRMPLGRLIAIADNATDDFSRRAKAPPRFVVGRLLDAYGNA